MKRRGFTLIEVIVYLGLFLVIATLLAQVYSLSTQTQRTTASAYAVTGQTDTAMHWLRRDLQQTALASVRSYSGGAGSSALLSPAVTLASARVQAGSDLQSKLLISEYGAPGWAYHVFYGLPRKAGEQTGTLVRWESAYAPADVNRIPQVATMPRAITQVVQPRVILHNVLCPGQKVERLNGMAAGWPASDWGGFRVEFVRRRGGEGGEEYFSPQNPSENVKEASDNSRLIEVELGVCEPSMGAPNFYNLKFRICPRY